MLRLDLENMIREGKHVEWLMNEGVLKRDVVCDICGDNMKLHNQNSSADGKVFGCGKLRCGRARKSVREGSFFWGYKQPLEKLIRFVYEWAEETKQKKICRELGICKKTAVSLSDRLRHIVYSHVQVVNSSNFIGGEGKVVEIDETVVARRKYNVGRRVKEQWLFGGIVRGTLGGPIECFAELVNDRTAKTLEEVVKARVHPDSFICKDGWRGYVRLGDLFKVGTVNHSKNFVNPEDRNVHTQSIESMWNQLKTFLREHKAFKREKLELYINEFIFRKSCVEVFNNLIQLLK